MLQKLKHTLDLIKFSHSIFALPFALVSLFWATKGHPEPGLLIKIILAMFFARSAAMAFNRLVDASIDAKNPRTQTRHIPAQILSRNYVFGLTVVASLFFVIVCYYINELSFKLSPLALAIVLFYSLTKRFTHLTQLALGIALGISPIAAWIAATGTFSNTSCYLALAVAFWVAGFDIIYATQDYHFDLANQVKSLVVRLGISRALTLARILHLFTILFLIIAGLTIGSQWIYFFGILLVSGLFIYEHSLIKPQDLSRVNAAFFTVNGFIGIIYFVSVLVDLYLL